MKLVTIALGSNLDQPAIQLNNAMTQIANLSGVTVLRTSSFYQTKPIGYVEQDDFVNAVLQANTSLSAEALLLALQGIENDFGRIRTFQNAPRTLDLDIVDYAHEVHNSPVLTLPHPRAHERGFVMVPLAEIAPDYCLGEHPCAADLAQALQEQGVEKLP